MSAATKRPTRGYSRAFTPATDRRVQLMIDRVPPALMIRRPREGEARRRQRPRPCPDLFAEMEYRIMKRVDRTGITAVRNRAGKVTKWEVRARVGSGDSEQRERMRFPADTPPATMAQWRLDALDRLGRLTASRGHGPGGRRRVPARRADHSRPIGVGRNSA